VVISVFSVLAACGGSGSSALSSRPPVVPPQTSGQIPALSPGPHLGYIVGFETLDARQTADADNHFSEAVAAGMRISRIQISWEELEPAPGIFESGNLMIALDQATVSGQQPFLTLTTLDTGGLTIPLDLMAADRLTPAAGLTLDGPEILGRFHAFLDWLIPEIAAYKVWGLAIANEPSSLFESMDQQEITGFLIDGADYAGSLTDKISITATLAGAADNDPQIIRFVADLMPHFDIASYNFYCLDSNTLQTTGQTVWEKNLNTFISRARGREVFFQELGCPAGWGDLGGSAVTPRQVINATPQIQTSFFRFMFVQIESRDILRAATVFQLYDWSPGLARSFSDPYRLGGDPVTADRLEEWLATIGLCRWSDRTCREAYDIFLEGVAQMATVRSGL